MGGCQERRVPTKQALAIRPSTRAYSYCMHAFSRPERVSALRPEAKTVDTRETGEDVSGNLATRASYEKALLIESIRVCFGYMRRTRATN